MEQSRLFCFILFAEHAFGESLNCSSHNPDSQKEAIMKVSMMIWLAIGAIVLVGAAITNFSSSQGVTGAFKSDSEWVEDEVNAMLEDEMSAADKADFCQLLADDFDFRASFKEAAVDSTVGVDLNDSEIGAAALAGARTYCR